jgi:hypothetical protein
MTMKPSDADSTESQEIPVEQPAQTFPKDLMKRIVVPFADDFVYANCSAFSTTFMDVRVSFGEVLPTGVVKAKVGIVMPAEHAAHVTMALFQQLAVFETNFGPIRNPEWTAFKLKASAASSDPPTT